MNTPVRFVLDGNPHSVDQVAPTRTVLQYLREDLGRMGTKEGCAEGDCGACTVVVAERLADPGGERLRWRALNACILFVPALDGKALFTIDGLDGAGTLHPAQQAMITCHGSQCGFCTPGIVMSLYALARRRLPEPDRRAVNEALAGNLCRCTGYRPIVDAAVTMAQTITRDPAWREREDAADARLLAQLRELQRPSGVRFGGPAEAGAFHAPRTLAELEALRRALPHARVVGGATDVGLWVTKKGQALGDILYTGQVEELRQARQDATHLEIGAAVSVADAAPLLVREYPDFDELFRRFASPPIRNAATLGGNIANGSPIGDSMPGLIALGAEVVLCGGAERRALPLEDFYLGYQRTALRPGEIVAAVRVPRSRAGLQFRTSKLSKRFDQDISAVCAALALTLDTGTVGAVRIAFGGMAATPRRAPRAEAAALGQPWNEATVRAMMAALDDDYAPIGDMRATSAYRRATAANLLWRFYLETCAGGIATRLYDFELARGA